MQPCRILFMGTPAFAVPSLALLTERPDLCHVVATVTQPDKPQGRGRKMAACPVKIAASARGIPCLAPTRLKAPETYDELAAFAPDLIVVAAYGRILPPTLLALPRLGCINVHASLLPKYRGASPIAHAIAAGDTESGVAIMRMEAGLDTGPVYAMAALPIAPTDTCNSLTIKLAESGAQLLVRTLPDIIAGRAEAVPQDDAGATYAPLLTKDDGWLDFRLPAAQLARHVRAFHPWPGTFVVHGGNRLAVLGAHAVDAPAPGVPGVVLEASNRGVVIQCGQGALCLDEVKPAGKNAMPASAYVAGRSIAAGITLDPPPPTRRKA